MAIVHFRYKDRRRTMRAMLAVPLKVHGETSTGETFSVFTKSHTVTANGGAVELGITGIFGRTVVLENQITLQEIEGKVASVRSDRNGKTYVGIEFLEPEVDFWHMKFPASGARPLRRSIPSKEASA